MRDPRMSRLGAETTGYVVGPMPVKDFLRLYVPRDPQTTTNQPKFDREEAKQLKELLDGLKEEDMYKPWVERMTRYSPKYRICDIHAQELMEFGDISIKPDIVLCLHTLNKKKVDKLKNKKNTKQLDMSRTENLNASETNKNSPPETEKIEASEIELFGEFKAQWRDDPFIDNDHQTVEADNNQARDTLGQLAAYATCHMGI
ncbi:hypothetical protein AX17_003664 [Amanita inopinata Kibby_2008]|nr:hypothetical protein AX17_003664 [Amanita inopinata Kibby_2008]